MKCKDLQELLSAYADDELPRTQREFVEEHLAGCADCRAILADYMTVRQQLTSLRTTPVMPDIKQGTMSKIKAMDMLKKSPLRWMRPALVAGPIIAILIALLVLHPWSGLGPQGVMAKVYAATSSLQSYRMTSTLVSIFEGETSEQSSEWEFAFPNRYHGKVTLEGEAYEFIIIGDKKYAREAADGRLYIIAWSRFIPSKEHTLEILDSLTDLKKLPDEKIEGVDCYHYWGRVDMERMIEEHKAELEQLSTMKHNVELWIGKEDYLIRQIIHDMDGFPLEGTSRAVAKYYDFNEPITIEPPETASGELLVGWRLLDGSAGSESKEPPYPSKTPPSR